ncbi:hypothetical protein [Metaclostridioides mangenotii]|uniref:hypothetical protein n=1 Tax=Metaclostridioides mangenotii TaxID=1540 RepID=UPI0028EDC048|nr:hypothetical protein [Clostridioides mangenotii]
MNNKKSKYIIGPFLGLIFGLFIINIISPNKNYSVAENRSLEKRPALESVVKGTYVLEYEKYFNDHFPFREQMISFNTKSEAALNKTKVGNYYLGDNNWILGLFPKVLEEKQINSYSNALNELSEISQSLGIDVYFTMMPHKTNMLRHLYPKYVDNKGNIDININSLKSCLEPDLLTYIDIDDYFLNNFNEKEREKLYFKTDHH